MIINSLNCEITFSIIITDFESNRNPRRVSWQKRIHLYRCKFSGRRLPVASSIRTEHEYNDVQRSVRRAMSSVESRIDEWSITNISAISAQHPRDVTHLSRDREIRERYRDLISYILWSYFCLLFCIVIMPKMSSPTSSVFLLNRLCYWQLWGKKKSTRVRLITRTHGRNEILPPFIFQPIVSTYR